MTHGRTTGQRKHGRSKETALLDALRAVENAPEAADRDGDGQPGPLPAKPSLKSYAAYAVAARPLQQESGATRGPLWG